MVELLANGQKKQFSSANEATGSQTRSFRCFNEEVPGAQ